MGTYIQAGQSAFSALPAANGSRMALALTVTHIYERGKEEGRIQLLGLETSYG